MHLDTLGYAAFLIRLVHLFGMNALCTGIRKTCICKLGISQTWTLLVHVQYISVGHLGTTSSFAVLGNSLHIQVFKNCPQDVYNI